MLFPPPLYFILLLVLYAAPSASVVVPDGRPAYVNRTFHSQAVDTYLNDVVEQFKDKNIGKLFTNTFPNTLDTTVGYHDASDSFIITGDIDAMWLRDSCNQVLPYLPFIKSDDSLDMLLSNLVMRMSRSVLIDSYANAFNFDGSEISEHASDERIPMMSNFTFEGKYELDSLAAFLKLSRSIWESGSVHLFSSPSSKSLWLRAVRETVTTITTQQQGTDEDSCQDRTHYSFQRTTSEATDTLMQSGHGAPCARTGMSKCQFRPSDDAVVYPFLVPANAMAVVELRKVADVVTNTAGENPDFTIDEQKELASDLLALASSISGGIYAHGVITHSATGKPVFAYEVDGFGNSLFMDDANIPSLLALPYLGFAKDDDEIYLNTREAILSRDTNPFFFKGAAGEGVGGPHAGYGMIWPMGIAVRGMTSTDEEEISTCLEMLVEATANTGFMHESFWKDDSSTFTRSWFAWANSLFGEFIVKLMEERPGMILKEKL